ncbi:MAG TPA: tryptophan synthase subunit alpha [Puia sp.]|nr:tryptophan synthase subunit alpha [Puia sp.]
MGRIGNLFERKKDSILSIYFTAGFPELTSTLPIMKALQKFGADMIELGIPYSDPLADGPVIQASGSKAIANGMTIPKLLDQLRGFRTEIGLPTLMMGYLNPIIQFGFEKFCKAISGLGIDGLIIPDLPLHEFEEYFETLIKKFELDFVFLVTPETPDNRLLKLDGLSSGFLYAVSSSSITGRDKNFDSVENYVKRLKELKLRNPIMVGFGVKDRETFSSAAKYANGAIVGTAFVNQLGKSDNVEEATRVFMQNIR